MVTASIGSLFHSVIVEGKKENLKISLCPFCGMCAALSDLFNFNSLNSVPEGFFLLVRGQTATARRKRFIKP